MGALLLPPNNSETYERCIADACAVPLDVRDGIAAIRYDKLDPPSADFLPFLVWEYGLGELTPYVPNLYDLLREGLGWQRLRGTPAAMTIGLGWIGHVAVIEEAWTERRWWNSYQLHFEDLPLDAALENIEGITRLSTPRRSQLYRVTHGYDARACELERSALDHCMLDVDSGIGITDAGTIWSFARETEIEHSLTEAEGIALGNWIPSSRELVSFGSAEYSIEPPEEESSLYWAEMNIPWKDATFPWASDATSQRQSQMAAWFAARPIHLVLRAATGGVIGFRRCRVVRAVTEAVGGPYSFRDVSYAPASGGRYVYIEAMTDFGDADGITAAAVSLLVGASAADGIPPGRLWLQPGDLTGGIEIASNPVSLPLRATVREQITYLMRF